MSTLRFEDLIGLWQEGEQRLRLADPADRRALDRVVDELMHQLRRRVGGPFSVQELARHYTELGTDWCFDVAVRIAPGTPAAWDLTTVAGAAYARYAREAGDYMVGRHTAQSERPTDY